MIQFKVGDRVRIKQYEDMAKDYDLDKEGNILVGLDTFVTRMKHLCGRKATISKIWNSNNVKLVDWSDTTGNLEWIFTTGMLEPVIEKHFELNGKRLPMKDIDKLTENEIEQLLSMIDGLELVDGE